MTETTTEICRGDTPAFEPSARRANDDFIGGPIRSRPSRPDPAWATDEQADGCWANVVRAYEDGPCN
ncbi:MAG: hypothetical protein AAFP26_03205 [Planctomycetota bacterium]